MVLPRPSSTSISTPVWRPAPTGNAPSIGKWLEAEAVILILTKNWFDSKWCFAEFTQARALGKAIFPLIEAPTGETLVSPDIQHLDLVKDREGGLARLRRS